MMTIFIVLGVVLGLIVLPVLINLDYGGSVWNTFNSKLTQTQKRDPQNEYEFGLEDEDE